MLYYCLNLTKANLKNEDIYVNLAIRIKLYIDLMQSDKSDKKDN